MKPINERRSTHKFCIDAQHIERIALINTYFASSGERVVAVAHDGDRDRFYVVRTISERGVHDHEVEVLPSDRVSVVDTDVIVPGRINGPELAENPS